MYFPSESVTVVGQSVPGVQLRYAVPRHIGDARLTGILHAVAVLVQPDAVADGTRLVSMSSKSCWS